MTLTDEQAKMIRNIESKIDECSSAVHEIGDEHSKAVQEILDTCDRIIAKLEIRHKLIFGDDQKEEK